MREEAPIEPPRYEPKDADPRVVGATAAVMAATIVASILAGRWVYLGLGQMPAGLNRPSADSFFQNGVSEETSIEKSWDDLRRDERGHLDGYGWADRRAGTARIPIERAMDLVGRGPGDGPGSDQKGDSSP